MRFPTLHKEERFSVNHRKGASGRPISAYIGLGACEFAVSRVVSGGSCKVATLVLVGALSAVCWSQSGSPSSGSSSTATHKKHASTTTSHATASKTTHKSTTRKSTHGKRRPLTAKQKAKSHKLQQAFIASSQLRPMAQQLATMRTPAAYAGVSAYARSHTGEASAAAWEEALDRAAGKIARTFAQSKGPRRSGAPPCRDGCRLIRDCRTAGAASRTC